MQHKQTLSNCKKKNSKKKFSDEIKKSDKIFKLFNNVAELLFMATNVSIAH